LEIWDEAEIQIKKTENYEMKKLMTRPPADCKVKLVGETISQDDWEQLKIYSERLEKLKIEELNNSIKRKEIQQKEQILFEKQMKDKQDEHKQSIKDIKNTYLQKRR